MTQTAPASLDLLMQFDRFEEKLEDWCDQLTQLSPYLPAGDAIKLAHRWETMRQNLDTIFLHYGRSPSRLVAVMDGLPPLRELTQNELDMTLDALLIAKKALNNFTRLSQQRLPLLDQALKNGENPARLRRSIDKMEKLQASFATRLQALKLSVDQFDSVALYTEESSLLETTRQVIDQTQRVEALRNANSKLELQKEKMQTWLKDSKRQLQTRPAHPPPSAGALGIAGQSLTGSSNDTDKALESLFLNRDKLREARRYLETLLISKESL